MEVANNTAAEAGVEGKLDSGRRVERFVEGILSDARRRTRTLSDHEIGDLADRVIRRVEDARARFSIDHVTAETERAIASLRLSPDRERDTVKAVLAAATPESTEALAWAAALEARSEHPLAAAILAAADQDREGYVPNVVYTCGAIRNRQELFIPYGVADSAVCFAFAPIAGILAALV